MRALVIVPLLCGVASAEQAERCALSRSGYNADTNEVTETADDGVVMRGPDGGDICAEPDRIQAWINQGYTIMTSSRRGREVRESAERANAEENEQRNDEQTAWWIGGAIVAALGCYGIWRVTNRKS